MPVAVCKQDQTVTGKIAKLLLNNGTSINDKNKYSENIIEYLINKKQLDSDKLSFILNVNKNASLISTESLCQLINFNKYDILKDLFKYCHRKSSHRGSSLYSQGK